MNTPTNQPPHRITPENPPQFPCWLWHCSTDSWRRFNRDTFIDRVEPALFSHWHPDQPTAPTAVPEATPPARRPNHEHTK